MKEINRFIKKLQTVQSLFKTFKEKSISENLELLAKMSELKKVVPDDVRIELKKAKFKIRYHILTQMALYGENGEYKNRSLEECFKHFKFAHSLDYGCGGIGNEPYWSGGKEAPRAQNAIFPILFEKLVSEIEKGGKEKESYLRMLWGLRARYNWSTPQYKKVEEVMLTLDPKKEFEHRYL